LVNFCGRYPKTKVVSTLYPTSSRRDAEPDSADGRLLAGLTRD
jgi:hypothetical protein